MYDTTTISSSVVPLDQIAETRRSFPGKALSFELLLSVQDPIVGLERCASVFRRAGIDLLSLRCSAQGRICCRLGDREGADLLVLVRDLSGPDVLIESWTTVLGTGAA